MKPHGLSPALRSALLSVWRCFYDRAQRGDAHRIDDDHCPRRHKRSAMVCYWHHVGACCFGVQADCGAVMIWKCDREPPRDAAIGPSPPPSDAYLNAWMAQRGMVQRRDDDLPADVAVFLREI